MPEIDTDTFQVIALGLAGLALLVSLVLLSMVSKLRKDVAELGRGGVGSGEPRSDAATPAQHEAEPAVAAEAPAQTSTTETFGTTASDPAPQTASAQTAAAAPTAESTAGTSTAGAATAADIPEEQPFERDGRWWYKRGDEFLVYDETSGQWEPAPAGSLSTMSATKPAAETAYTPMSEASPGTAQTPASGGEDAGMWKCPSCGAVNGGTAASCRMCFTARP